jgi:hypothetical protein
LYPLPTTLLTSRFSPVNKADRKDLHQNRMIRQAHQIRKKEEANGKHCVMMMGRNAIPSVTQLGFQLPDE